MRLALHRLFVCPVASPSAAIANIHTEIPPVLPSTGWSVFPVFLQVSYRPCSRPSVSETLLRVIYISLRADSFSPYKLYSRFVLASVYVPSCSLRLCSLVHTFIQVLLLLLSIFASFVTAALSFRPIFSRDYHFFALRFLPPTS